MAWAIIGNGGTAAPGTSSNVAIALANTDIASGSFRVVLVSVRDSYVGTVDSVDDDQGNSYTQRMRRSNSTIGFFVEQWTSFPASTLATNVTVHFSSAVQTQIHVMDFSGGTGSISVADSNSDQSTGLTHPCGSVSAVAGDLMVTMATVSNAAPDTANSSYTALFQDTRSFSQWREAAGSVTDDGTFTSTVAQSAVATQVVYRSGAAGGATIRPGTLRMRGLIG